jgi:hypothetical protein
MKQSLKDAIKEGKPLDQVTKDLIENAGKNFGALSATAMTKLEGASEEIQKELKERGGLAGEVSESVIDIIKSLATSIQSLEIPKLPSGGTTLEDDFWTKVTSEGMSGANRNLGAVADQVREQKSLIELLGEIKVNVNFQDMPTGLSSDQKEQITKTISDKLNEDKFKDYIVRVTNPTNVFRGGGAATY